MLVHRRYAEIAQPAVGNEEQYATVDDALTFASQGGVATTLYADGSNSVA